MRSIYRKLKRHSLKRGCKNQRLSCWGLFMVQSGELRMWAPVFLRWCRADTRCTRRYTELHGQTSANTTHHHGSGGGTRSVLYTDHIRLQHLKRHCPFKGLWHNQNKKNTDVKASWPTGSHWEELLEWPTIPHAAVFQVWAKRLLLFPGVYLATLTPYHTLPLTVILHHCLFDQCG